MTLFLYLLASLVTAITLVVAVIAFLSGMPLAGALATMAASLALIAVDQAGNRITSEGN